MKTHTAYLSFNTKNRIEFVRITDQVENEIKKSGVKEGLVLINPMHITSAVIVNDNESGLIEDFKRTLERLVPYHNKYAHNTGEDNAASHIWRQLIGHQVVMPITNGELDLGPWEQVFYCEFDGQRSKRVLIKIIGEGELTEKTKKDIEVARNQIRGGRGISTKKLIDDLDFKV